MKNSLSEKPDLQGESLVCGSLLWIGDSEHHELRRAWQTCQQLADTISIRRSIADAIERPPRQIPTHLIVAQTNRHDRAQAAIDGEQLSQLQISFPNTRFLVLRGALVSPTVRLPRTSGATPGNPALPWVDSISVFESVTYLTRWLAASSRPCNSFTLTSSQLPLVMVAARYCYAESYLDSLRLLASGDEAREPLVAWQRELTPRSGRGFATVVWDESAAPPAAGDVWQQRCESAPQATHVWISAMATTGQRETAIANGIEHVLNKPSRLFS
jgi:hypothetical protein